MIQVKTIFFENSNDIAKRPIKNSFWHDELEARLW